jgi:hypothetical protein
MLSLDLFNSKFEQPLVEGAVDRVVEQDPSDPQEKIPTNINQFNTEDNRALVKRIWAQISQHAINDTAGWLTLEWPNQPAATLSRNQVWTVINKIAKMPATQRNAFALSTLGDRNAFLTWMNGLKIIPRPAPKKDVPKGQQSLDLKELDQKKSSEDNKYRDVRVARAMRQAAAEFPSAGSDVEAFAKSMLNAQDQDQEDIAKLRQTSQRQRELIKKNDSLDADQQRTIVNIEKEIDDVERSNSTLEKTVQQMQRANQALQQKLDQMRGRATQATATPVAPELGVSVATDKTPAAPAPVTTAPTTTAPAIDPRARQYAQALRKQLNQLQTMAALKAPEDQNQLKQDIDALKAQLSKLQQKEPVATATPATVGGQAADIMPARDSTDTDDGVIDLTGVDDVLAQFRQPAKKTAKKKAKKQEPEFELTEQNKIPQKKVFGGCTITFDPATKTVSAFRGLSGPQQGQSVKINNATPGAYLRAVRHLLGDEIAEGSVFGQQKFDTQMDLAKLKSQLEKIKPAQSAPAEPQPVAYQPTARLSDLQLRKQRVDNLASIKQTIEQLQARATRGGRELPPGLAADLEDYFTTADIDTDYDEMMSKYQRQLAALQKYLNLRRAVWAPKKDIQENKSSEAYEQGGRAGYYGRAYNNPYESGTEEHADYKRGYRDFRDEGKDYGVDKPKKSSTIDRDRDYLESVDRSGSPMYKAQEAYMIVHNGRDIAFYKPSDMKQAYTDAEELAKKHGGEVHVKKVMRETEQPPQDEVMKRLFKDFGDIFGKQPPQPKSQQPEKKEVKEMGRAGYNPMQTEKDWIEVERYLSQMINEPTLDPETRKEYRQRYLEKRQEAQLKGWTK